MKGKSESAQDSSGRRKRPSSALIENPKPWDWSGNLRPRSRLMEEDVRRVVREELEHAKKSHSAEYCQSCTGTALKGIVRSLENAVQKLEEAVEPKNSHHLHGRRDNCISMAMRNLQLRLQTKLSLPIFTGRILEGEGGARISVALVDANTGDVVTSGPESSIKLDVVVLEGDFNKDDDGDWAQQEFENYVVKEREGKRPLLAGNLHVTLKGGAGELGDLMFTDNSSWNRSKRFRIGLKVSSDYCGNMRIREAKTDAFAVKEHRGESYQKNYPPKADDEVWRLEKIAKDGKIHNKLSEAGIDKVEDFLLQLFTDSDKLREILGKSIILKNWDTLVHHAKTCKINWKLYLYYLDNMRKHGALFDTNRQLIALIKDRAYIATHRLSVQEKEHGHMIVKKALDNKNDVMEFNGETFSPSMQKKSTSSTTPQICAASGGLEATPANMGLPARDLCLVHHRRCSPSSTSLDDARPLRRRRMSLPDTTAGRCRRMPLTLNTAGRQLRRARLALASLNTVTPRSPRFSAGRPAAGRWSSRCWTLVGSRSPSRLGSRSPSRPRCCSPNRPRCPSLSLHRSPSCRRRSLKRSTCETKGSRRGMYRCRSDGSLLAGAFLG